MYDGCFPDKDICLVVKELIDRTYAIYREMFSDIVILENKKKKGGKSMEPDKRSVFLVYGRNEKVNEGMRNLIYNMGLNVIEFDDAVIHTGKSSPTIFEVLEVAFLKAQAIIVLCTGDENVYLKKELAKNGQEEQNRMQPRPNVIFEAGMAWQRDRDRTIIIFDDTVEMFSDLQGVHYLKIPKMAGQKKQLFERLINAGCDLDKGKTTYLDQDFFD